MKIAIIDLSFHKKTKSTWFLDNAMTRMGEVQRFYVDENMPSLLAEIADMDFDLIVAWQTEFCAPYFMARGKPTLIIPMYDGCGGLPNLYWRAMRPARALSFSRKLHGRLCANGIDSLALQYFPDPKQFTPVKDFSNLRGFFWQRRPKEGMTWQMISGLCPGLDALHVHLAADDGDNDAGGIAPHVTTSRWSTNAAAYTRHLEASNVFFASRQLEGIGMANLEAMARGMCVVANDGVTANEYIIDKVNGRLYDAHNPKKLMLTPEQAERYGRAARKTVERGYEKFHESIDDILWFIESTPKPNASYGRNFPADKFIRAAHYMFTSIHKMMAVLAEAEGSGAFIPEEKFFHAWERLRVRIRHIPVIESFAWRVYGKLRHTYKVYRARMSR